MPSQLHTPFGSAGDDFLLSGAGPTAANGGDGDDYILGDNGGAFTTGTANSFAASSIIDNSAAWTTDENPFFQSAQPPHTSLYVLADAGQMHYSSVTVGAGQTIRVDIDFGFNQPIGLATDVEVDLLNSGGGLLVTSTSTTLSSADAGSVSFTDPFLVFTNTGNVSQIYTIRFYEFTSVFGGDGGVFEGGETFVANISVTGHTVSAPTITGDDTLTGGNGDDSIAGQGGNDTLLGNSGNDTLYGGSGNDLLDGGDGTDQASYVDAETGVIVDLTEAEQNTGGGGIDTLLSIEDVVGSNHADTLIGTAAANVIRAGGGNDNVAGADGDDALDGEDGDDTLSGGSGNDSLDGADGNDILLGGAGHDIMTGGFGDDHFAGGSGNDILLETYGNDQLDGGSGIDMLRYNGLTGVVVDLSITAAQDTVGAGIDTISGIENVDGSAFGDTLIGNAAANIINGRGSNDALNGGDGNDTLSGDAGDDLIIGANGTDSAGYATSGAAVTVSLAITFTQDTVGAGNDTLTDIENLIGTNFGDTLTGNAGINVLSGGGGNDILDGGDGNDTLVGEAGDDSINGGIGNDTASYDGAAIGVVVSLALNIAQNTVGAGNDTLGSIERLTGSSFADTLTGNGGINVLFGSGGHDILDGADNDDSLLGGDGNDTLTGGAGNDSLNGGTGNDTVSYAATASTVVINLAIAGPQNTGGAGNDTLVSIERATGSGFNDTLTGSALANVLSGEAGADTLDGAAGDDLLLGGDGIDLLVGGAGNDTLNGGAGYDTASYATNGTAVTVNLATTSAQNTVGAGSDTLVSIENLWGSAYDDTLTGSTLANSLDGGNGNDVLDGGAGNDVLLGGGNGNDSLNGGTGNDTLIGNNGNDALNGGTGVDLFRFNSALSAATNVDTISDFSVADDTIQLSLAVFAAAGGIGTLAAAAFRAGASASDASDRIIYNSATGQIFYDSDGNGATAQVLFAQVTVGLALTNADFSIIG